MKKGIVFIISVFISIWSFGQSDTTMVAVNTINSDADDIACTMINNKLVYTTSNTNYELDDFGSKKNHFHLFSALKAKNNLDFSSIEGIFDVMFPADIGTACYNENEKTLWFSSAYNFDQQKSKSLKIYYSINNDGKWSQPKPFIHNSQNHNTAHPFLNANKDQLFFSSDRKGGAGGMDIWYCNKIKDGWSDPIWAGYTINTKYNEIFPSWHNGDLYFSSDGHSDAQGLDIYKAYQRSNWEEVKKLPGKINSTFDDFGILFLDDNQGYFSSNRPEENKGDNIFLFNIAKNEEGKLDNNKLVLSFNGTPIRNATVIITNTDNIIITDGITGNKGSIYAKGMYQNTTYNVLVSGVENIILSHSILQLISEDDKILATYRFDKNGNLQFEYIPFEDFGDIPNIDITDYSILSLEMSGQIYNQEPGDVGEGIPVYIYSDSGEILALAYTSSQGQFTTNDLRPLKDYKFVIKGDNQIGSITLNESNKTKIIELENNLGTYQRLSENQAIKLLDENNNPIYIGKNEIFVVREIYYKFDSDELNKFAKSQLRYLSLILENNPEIKIELGSHTDSRGTSEYNLNLSKRRAKVAAAYLESVGISSNRLTPIGYGENKLKNKCNDTTECEEKLHAVNRRTEIRIFVD